MPIVQTIEFRLKSVHIVVDATLGDDGYAANLYISSLLPNNDEGRCLRRALIKVNELLDRGIRSKSSILGVLTRTNGISPYVLNIVERIVTNDLPLDK